MNGTEIKAWRKSLGLTQHELAVHVLGIYVTTLRLWEKGQTIPNPIAQKLLAEVKAGMEYVRINDPPSYIRLIYKGRIEQVAAQIREIAIEEFKRNELSIASDEERNSQ